LAGEPLATSLSFFTFADARKIGRRKKKKETLTTI
jgi:hypothetical protein